MSVPSRSNSTHSMEVFNSMTKPRVFRSRPDNYIHAVLQKIFFGQRVVAHTDLVSEDEIGLSGP